jgi:hypothetical protein
MTIEAQLADGTTLEFPDGTKPEVIQQTVKNIIASQLQDETGGVKKAARAAEFASRGFVDSAMEYAGLPGEAVYAAGRALGVTDKPYGTAQKYLKEGARDVGRSISDLTGINAVTDFGPDTPQSTLERAAHGAGRGSADALSFMVPGLAAAKYAKAGSTLAGVGNTLKAQPVAQLAAGSTGGGVSEATDSQTAGLAASLLTPTLPLLARKAAGKVITPFASQLNPNEQKLAIAAQRMGIDLTPGQFTGSPSLRTAESSFTQMPFTSAKQIGKYDQQTSAFNRHVLSKAGIDADTASPEVLKKAFSDIGKEFDELAMHTRIDLTPQLQDDITGMVKDLSRYVDDGPAKILNSYAEDLVQLHRKLAGNPALSGQEYQRLASKIRAHARKTTKDADLKEGLLKLARRLDDELEAASPELKGAWRDVRNRYRNLLIVDEAAGAGTGASRARADIPFAGLRQAVKKSDRAGYGRSRGDLGPSADVGDFLSSAIPADSGTGRRNLMNYLLTGGGGMGGGAVLGGGDPITVVAGLLGTLATPKLVQSLMNTKGVQAWFRNQAIQPTKQKLTKELLFKLAGAQALGDQTEGTR